MQLGIIGLARSGKTSVFNAVTGGSAEVGAYSTGDRLNVGVVNVPDSRVDGLAKIYSPKKSTYATIEYVDFPAAGESFGKGDGPAGKFVNDLGRMDAFIHVVRAFQDESVPHPEVDIDPTRDIETMDLELAFADLAIIERRLHRIDTEMKSMKPAERTAMRPLEALLARLKDALEGGTPIREQAVTADEWKLLEGTQFMTAKKLLVIVNVGEQDLEGRGDLAADLNAKFQGRGRALAVMGGKFEMELNELDGDEAEEFRQSVGVIESGLEESIRLSYQLLGLISFLTSGEDECRAWSVQSGSTAPEAAGKIHTDLQRGFIRAEVVAYDDLIRCGSESEAKKQGLVSTEGKDYVVKDGDILHILFNV